MAKKYDPRKKLFKVWEICKNPLKMKIAYEDRTGRYILSDPTGYYGRIIDVNEGIIYTPIYVINILKFNPPWHKYTGEQDKLKDLLSKMKTIWYTDKDGKDFDISEYGE